MDDQPGTKAADVSAAQVEAVLGVGRERSRLAWRVVWLVVAVAAVAAVVYWLTGNHGAALRYVTAPVGRGDLTVTVTATGSVQPLNKVDVSSELSGTVRKVMVDYNSEVEPGQVLAELDVDKLNAQVRNSKAQLAAAKAHVAEAAATITEKRNDLTRKRTLVERGAGSKQDLDAAQAAYERALAEHQSALAQVDVAQAELSVNETNLRKACICAPIKGIVLSRNVDPGQTVATSLQAPVLFTIAEDLTQMELQVDVDEADVGKTKVGQTATFTVDAYPDRDFPAKIRDIRFASEVVQGVVTYKAVLTVDNSELLLRPGMTATAEIVVQKVHDALLVPNQALRFDPASDAAPTEQRSFIRRLLPGPPRFRVPSAPETHGAERTVWVLADGAPQPRKVTIGATDGQHTVVKSGALKAGETVIVDSVTGAP